MYSIANVIPHGWIVAIFDVFLGIVVMVSFFVTAYMDPGVIPRQHPPPPAHGDDLFRTNKPPPVRDIILNGVQFQQKYCDTCNLYRPPRAIHCGLCNNCVDRFDHHCPWVGNCVGRRNYRWFLVFIYGVMVHTSFMIAICIAEFAARYNIHALVDGSTAFVETLKNPVGLLLSLYSLAVAIFVGILACFHCKLVSQNITTNEHIKKLFKTGNPHDRGLYRNWIFMCCPPFYPRFVRWRDRVDNAQHMLLNP